MPESFRPPGCTRRYRSPTANAIAVVVVEGAGEDHSHGRPKVPSARLPEPGRRAAPTAAAGGRRRSAERRDARQAHRLPVWGVRRGPADRDRVARAVPELPRRHPCLSPVCPLRHGPALRVRSAHPRAAGGQERAQRLRLVRAPRHGRARRLARLDTPRRPPPRLWQPLQEVGALMRTIDIHAHLVPRSLWRAADARRDWYGFRHEPSDGVGTLVGGGKRTHFTSPKVRLTPEERLKDMDAQGVDVQVVSIHTPLFGYHLDPAQGRDLARDVNDEIAAMARQWPQRFAGLATLPAQDVKAAVDELERAVTVLGLKGAELDTVDAIVVAILIFGGILDACPDLKVCIAHGGGPACFAMGRLDRGWQGRADARSGIQQPPSTYQRRLYYDSVTGSEEALRFLLDQVGADRVVLGSDWPFVPWHPSPVAWVQGLTTLTEDEKEGIL